MTDILNDSFSIQKYHFKEMGYTKRVQILFSPKQSLLEIFSKKTYHKWYQKSVW
tara:strand:+ start:4634 stop:4795 length:162 start_codon:yes stop_codon:yes gene_type:complete